MLKCASVYTSEIDDADAALNEIKSQISDKIVLLENTVGIITCHTEFIVAGALKHICENLPFDTVGITTAASATNDGIGEYVLSIFIMTSDDARFITGITESASDDIQTSVEATYTKATANISDQLKLILTFPPFFPIVLRKEYITAWENVAPGTPVFGSFAADDSVDFSESETIFNGVSYKDTTPFILCYGNINPRFLIGPVPSGNDIPSEGVVTKSKGSCVYEINHIKAYDYFKNLDIKNELTTDDVLILFPLRVHFKGCKDYDGVPVLRTHAGFVEDGAAIFYGDMPEGSTFSFATPEPEDIISSTLQRVEDVNNMPDVNGVLFFSSGCRRMVIIGINSLIELESAQNALNSQIPFLMGYSGGTMCPTSVANGLPVNRVHAYSLVVLVI